MTQPVAPTSPALGAADVSTDKSRLSNRANLEAAGKQFEAVFDGMMLKSMRQTKLADDLFDSKALDTFRDMQDQQVAKTMSEHAPLGIGKAMVDFLSKSQTALQAPAAPSATVGTPATGGMTPIGDGS
ncbi:rod-binding protein [Sphingomonas koreensis]|nr:rod-binding protein [Sphingomonas koreensis]